MEEHYVCKGDCKGVSKNPGVCSMEGCGKHKEHLEECKCEDGNHDKEEKK